MTMRPPKVVICASAAFYEHVNDIAAQLTAAKIECVVPKTAKHMAEVNDYDVSHYKTWYSSANEYERRAELVRTHFDEISKSDIVLVVNDEKHGLPNYIGPNVLMEISLAWYQKKPVYVLNGLPAESPFEEELKSFGCKLLDGDITKFISDVKKEGDHDT